MSDNYTVLIHGFPASLIQLKEGKSMQPCHSLLDARESAVELMKQLNKKSLDIFRNGVFKESVSLESGAAKARFMPTRALMLVVPFIMPKTYFQSRVAV